MSPSGWEQNAVYLQSGDPEKENTPTLMEPGLLGSRFTIMNPTGKQAGTVSRAKRYQLVRTDSTMAVGPYPGAVAYWADKSQYLTTTVNTNLNAVAGVYRCLVDKGNYCCVQVTGPSMVKTVDAPSVALAVGLPVVGSATVGKADTASGSAAPATTALGRVSTPLLRSPAEALVSVDLDVPETT